MLKRYNKHNKAIVNDMFTELSDKKKSRIMVPIGDESDTIFIGYRVFKSDCASYKKDKK